MLIRLLRSLRALGPGDGVLLLQAAAYWSAVRLALWLVPPQVLLRYVSTRADDPSPGNGAALPVPRLTWAVDAVGRRLPRSTCLVEALALQLLLARNRRSSRLCIGVKRGAEQEFLAHAWVEVDGKIVIGAQPGEWYHPLPDLGAVLKSGNFR